MTYNVAILGASGYTGAELVRIITTHPSLKIKALTADRKAGQSMGDVFPHLRHLDLPTLVTMDDVDFSGIDLAFAALPHGLTQKFANAMPKGLKVVDLSADFRLRDPAAYEKWYKLPHEAVALQAEAVYGLPEFYRDKIKGARITANTGCYVATTLLPMIPLLRAGVVSPDGIVVDAKSGVSGAGRGLSEGTLFAEVNEGFKAYGVGGHRHMGELDQELSLAAGREVVVSFTPHLLPISRGMQATIYASGDAQAVHGVLQKQYAKEPFVDVLPLGEVPQVQHVRGSNLCRIGVIKDRGTDRLIILSVLDNLMKGASGQAVQNANLMLGLDETSGLTLAPLFP
jgi:N-acetyl-gamma-glutamyl-phosphate reductase